MKILQNKVARAVYRLSFGHGGRTLVTGGSGGLDVWDLTTEDHRHIPSPDVTNYVCVCECDPLGRWFYVADSFLTRMYSFRGQDWQGLPYPVSHLHTRSLATSADGTRLVLSRLEVGQLECWATTQGPFTPIWGLCNDTRVDLLEEIPLQRCPVQLFHAVALSRDGRLVAVSETRPGEDIPFVALRNGDSGALFRDVGRADHLIHYRLTFTPDGRTLIGWGEKQVTLWDTATGAQVGRFAPGRGKLLGLALHPAGRILMTAGGDGTARTWDLATLRQTQALRWPVGKLSALAISPDGTLAAAGGEKGQVVLWDLD
jgi:WD40 repeat protein